MISNIISLIIATFLAIIGLVLLFKAQKIKVQKKYEQIEQLNQLQSETHKIEEQVKLLDNQVKHRTEQLKRLNQQKEDRRKYLDSTYDAEILTIKRRVNEFQQMTNKGLQSYVNNLEKSYKDADAAHSEKIARLKEEQEQTAADLLKLKETRKAAYEAFLKQKEVKENKQNYCLLPSTIDLDDIHSLEKIKQTLHKPRILSMLIWQTFWQPIAKQQFPIILQGKTKMGIYKITNLETDECYVGQAVDVYKRWCEHCKAGLGIDTPVGNKLYKAIQEYGLENFSFELLIECSQEELNTKEKYFIELYQSDLYGYNGQAGNRK